MTSTRIATIASVMRFDFVRGCSDSNIFPPRRVSGAGLILSVFRAVVWVVRFGQRADGWALIAPTITTKKSRQCQVREWRGPASNHAGFFRYGFKANNQTMPPLCAGLPWCSCSLPPNDIRGSVSRGVALVNSSVRADHAALPGVLARVQARLYGSIPAEPAPAPLTDTSGLHRLTVWSHFPCP